MSEPSREPELHFGLGKSLLFSAILITGVLVIAELGVRFWAFYLRDQYERFDRESGTFVLIPGEYSNGYRINRDGFVGDELRPDGPDNWRVVTLGDSCTFGWGTADGSYAAVLGDRLDARARGGRRYEVINAGVEGLNSELALRRLGSQVAPLGAEVVTIYVGWNDLMKSNPAAQSAGAEGSSGALTWLAGVLDRLWLAKSMRKLVYHYLRPRLATPGTGEKRRTGEFAGFEPTRFEGNLRATVAEVRRQGAEPVLVTLPSVLREDMTPADLRENAVVFPYFSAAYGVGDLIDLVEAYNRVIRRVAVEEDVPLANAAAAFAELDDPRPYFFDTMHPSYRGHELMADVLEATLERNGLLGPPS